MVVVADDLTGTAEQCSFFMVGERGHKLFCEHQRHKPARGGGGGGTRHALFSLCCYAISCILRRFLLYFAQFSSVVCASPLCSASTV